MSGAKEYLQVKFLKTLEPLGSLSVDKLEDIASKSQVEELPPGRVIFRQGEKDSRSTYLLSGQVELQVTGNPRSEVLKAKTVDARYPIAQEWPRPSTCRSKTNVVLLHIDSNLLEILLSDDPSGTYEVTEIGIQEDPESDWMLRFLQSPAFLQLPTENIQSILIHLEEVPMEAGEVVIKQGDSDDWYYIVKQGKCTVSRRPAPKAEEVRLAILGPGDGFGEEALITNGKRNATVTMKESGVLMRLSKADFHRLLVDPMLRTVDHATMTDMVKAGAALIDVRTNKEFSENGLKGAQNIPVSMLRLKSKDLNATREHIVYCNDTTQSRAAAFLLAQQSLQVYVLEGGLNGQSKPFSPAATAPVTKAATSPAQPAAVVAPTVTATDLGLDAIQDTNFINHKRAAEEKEKKASAAEQARKTAAAKSSQLKERADALRAQADNLARKTASAEEEKRAAQAEIDNLKQEAIKERDQLLASVKEEKEQVKQKEKEASQLRKEAEEARKRAEQELARIKAEAETVAKQQNELESKFRDAETEKQKAERAAEVARLMAQQEAEKVKAEAEAIRQKALKEAERMAAELEARKAKMAEQFAHHEKTALEEARRKATLDADQIRKQALKEAEAMRIQLEQERQKAAEQVARNKAEDQLRRQELESEKQKAIEAARKQAIQEAQIQAREEARRLAEVEAEQVRRQALEETEALRQKMIEEVSRKAMETAQLEAEAIRREALEEANRLRSEMEKTRLLVESEAKRAQTQIEEENNHAQAAKEAARLAAEEAERRRIQAEQEALAEQQRIAEEQARIAAQVEEQQRIAEEQARIAAQVEEQQRIAEEQARIAAQVEQQRMAEEQALAAQVEQQRVEAEREHKAKQMAEQLRTKLDQQEAERQEEEEEFEFSMGRGPKLAKAKLHVVKGKTILEGEEDIFVFKAPSERPPSRDEAEALLKKAEHHLAEKSRNELPSFDIEYADDDDEPASQFVIEQESEFSDSILLELDNITTNSSPAPKAQQYDDEFVVAGNDSIASRNKKRTSLIALAASVVVMVTISVVAITGPSGVDSENVASVEETTQPARGLASIRTRGNHKKAMEERMKSEAESEFNKLLSDWRKRNK